jgi:hypothetical protein
MRSTSRAMFDAESTTMMEFDQSLLRHERLQQRGRRARLEVDQGNDARDERVRRGLRADLARQPGAFDVLRRDDLHDRPGIDEGEALYLEDRLEDAVGLVDGDLARRDHRDLALDRLVDEEVPAGDLADELDEGRDLDVLEVHHDESIGGQRMGRLRPPPLGRRRHLRGDRSSIAASEGERAEDRHRERGAASHDRRDS